MCGARLAEWVMPLGHTYLNREVLGTNPTMPFRILGKFVHATLPTSLGMLLVYPKMVILGIGVKGGKEAGRACVCVYLHARIVTTNKAMSNRFGVSTTLPWHSDTIPFHT